jgi:hypothetical protein
VTTTVRYEGERLHAGPVVFTIDDEGNRRRLEHRVRYHSPDGFEWGYGGSGPAELALNILVDALGNEATCERCKGSGRRRGNVCPECRGFRIAEMVWRAHQALKWHFIAGLPDHRWSLERVDIVEWFERVVREAQAAS